MKKQKMRILQINENYYEMGGQERYFFDLINALKKKKHEVYSFGFAEKSEETPHTLIIKLSKNNLIRYYNRFLFDFRTYFKLRKWIKKIEPDIIHIHGNNRSTLAILCACRHFNIVHTLPNSALVCPTTWCVTKDDLKPCGGDMGFKCYRHRCISFMQLIVYYFHFMIRNALVKRWVTYYLAPNNKLKIYLEQLNFKNVMVVPYSINTQDFVPKKKQRKSIDLLFVGRLDPEKGVEFLIKSLPDVVVEKPDLKLFVVGEGSERHYLESLTKKLSLSKNVSFLGKVPFDQIKDYYALSSIFVMPSIYMEQFGLVGIEAMANSLPVIASDRGGIPDWCQDRKTGILIDPTNPEAIATAIKELLFNKPLAERFGKEGKKNSYKFDSEIQFNKILNIYKNFGEK